MKEKLPWGEKLFLVYLTFTLSACLIVMTSEFLRRLGDVYLFSNHSFDHFSLSTPASLWLLWAGAFIFPGLTCAFIVIFKPVFSYMYEEISKVFHGFHFSPQTKKVQK